MRRNFLATVALTLIACGVVIASLVAEPGPSGLFGAALGLLMLAIAVADARAYIIPDRLTLAALLLAFAQTGVAGFETLPENMALAALRGVVLALGFLALRETYFRLRRRQGIGLGDVKLAAVAGAWLDWPLIPVAIEIAAVLALIAYITNQLVLRRPLRATAKLPFGVFFAPAIWFCWLLGALFLKV
ncbi:A24 family peptidase [Methylocapsa sp. D3K7]|uniref:A24 family peptidase n=1 Tax=Methylocapsa sp. D3K7 TaxID=3041435 RepID=UPI00244E7748|nr:A24 family peptidase [Methylocapsa sp. D3K7]WGJ13381.1 A24 family peptidase [Methylocapsa sp. D3K7]